METYWQERRLDTLNLIVPTVAVVVFMASLIGALVFSPDDAGGAWSFWLMTGGSPIIAWGVLRLGRAGRILLAGQLFIIGHVILLTCIYSQTYVGGDNTLFLHGLLIVTSGLLIGLAAPFTTWLLAVLATSIVQIIVGNFSIFNIETLLPTFLNLGLAIVTYLTAYDWQIALESVVRLRRRAQKRRDELFTIQEELTRTNAALQFTNEALDKARQEALNERDLRTRFMNNVSHELRTPLNAVVNFAHILSMGGRGELNEGQINYLNRIEKSGNHVLHVLNDLLDMAQIQAGAFKLHLEPISLVEICEDAMEPLRGLIGDKDIEIVRDYPEEWPLIKADKVRLTQALINLLGNAAKYTQEGHIALRTRPGASHVTIQIEDTGIGIAPKYQALIFEEFRQVDETPARQRQGTGLGLPITRHLIEQHGGTIMVESEPGRGTTFTITLPIIATSPPI